MPNQHCTCERHSDIPGVEHAPSCPLVRYPIGRAPTHEEAQHSAAYGKRETDPVDVTGEDPYVRFARRWIADCMPAYQEIMRDIGTYGWGVSLDGKHIPLSELLKPEERKSCPVEVLPAVRGDAAERKAAPLVSGLLDYFPAALLAVAAVSHAANEQHNPGQPMHWERGKSGDEADALARHLVDRGLIDSDGLRHSAKVAWRALALLQKELEEAGEAPISRASWV